MSDATTTTETTETTTTDTDQSLGEAGTKALQAERDARKLAEKTARDTTKELADLKAAKVKADEEKQAEQGKWQELAEKRDADLQTAAKTLESATTELETLRGYVSGDVDSISKRVEALTDSSGKKVLLKVRPSKDASVSERMSWAEMARDELPDLEAATKEISRGAGPNPKPAGNLTEEAKSPHSRRAMLN